MIPIPVSMLCNSVTTLRAKPSPQSNFAAGRDEFNRFGHEIEEDLPSLASIGEQSGDIAGNIELKLNATF